METELARARADVEAEYRRLKPVLSCRGVGCSACCRGEVALAPGEIVAVGRAVEAKPRIIDRAVANRVALTTNETRAVCPALGPGGSCEIYAERPIACRAYGVVTPPEWCDPDLGLHEVGSPGELFEAAVRAILSLGYNPNEGLSLGRMVLAMASAREKNDEPGEGVHP